MFRVVPPGRHDLCEHCNSLVSRVWLVPGDVLNSCADCYAAIAGQPPVYEQGHSTQQVAILTSRPAPSFTREEGRRPA